MASHSLDTKFAFVNSSSYALPKDPGVRLLIRKQAMKEAGLARRRRRNYGMHNLRQFPIYLSSESPFEPAADSTTEDATKTEGANNVRPFGSPSLLLPDWITPYPKASSGQLDIGYNNQRGPDKARPQLVEDWLPTSANSFSRSPSNDYDEVYEVIQEEEDEHDDPGQQEFGYRNLPFWRRRRNGLPMLTNSDGVSGKSAHTPSIIPRIDLITSASLTTSQIGNLSLNNYELLRIKHGFDIISLSPLTTLHIGRAAVEHFIEDSSQLPSVFKYQRWSYLSYLPSRYGHITCLNCATDCVVARLRQIASPSLVRSSSVVSLYVNALKSLQSALDDPIQSLHPETLCATELLTLFEMFDGENTIGWRSHTNGAARLIKHRGPTRFVTELEKTLFMAQVGPIIIESLLNNTVCFLDQEPWQEVFRSTIQPDEVFSDRGELAISLWIHMASIPGLFRSVTTLVSSASSPTQSYIDTIRCQITQHRTSLVYWSQRFHIISSKYPYPAPPPTSLIGFPSKEVTLCDLRPYLFATYLSCVILMNRLLTALLPASSPALEIESQSLAGEILEILRHVSHNSQCGHLFMGQTVVTADATLRTAGDWNIAEKESIIDHKAFKRWNSLLGRKVD